MNSIRLPRSYGAQHAVHLSSVSSVMVRVAFTGLLSIFFYSVLSAVAHASAAPLQSLASIRAAAENHVRAAIQDSGVVTNTVFTTAAALDTRLSLQQCPNKLTTFTLNAAAIAARMTVGVRCLQTLSATASETVWTVYVPVDVATDMDTLVLRNSLQRGAHIAASDVEVQRRRVPGFGDNYVSDIGSLREQNLKRATPAGTVLTTNLLLRNLVIKRGQQVQLVFNAGGIAITASGLALSDGGTADRIRVQNQISLKVVEGVIESGNLVRVGM
jgi:flagellar basal body P-ring formation protein FlgA